MTARAQLRAAKAKAVEEKALAKQRLAELKASLKPGAVVGRWGRRTSVSVKAGSTAAVEAVRAHPAITVSAVAGVGLMLAAKPVGAFLADEFVHDQD